MEHSRHPFFLVVFQGNLERTPNSILGVPIPTLGQTEITHQASLSIQRRTVPCGSHATHRQVAYCGWTKSISHHFETMKNHCLLVFAEHINSFQGFFCGALHGFRNHPQSVFSGYRWFPWCSSKTQRTTSLERFCGWPLLRSTASLAPLAPRAGGARCGRAIRVPGAG